MTIEEVIGTVILNGVSVGLSAYFAGRKAQRETEVKYNDRLTILESKAQIATDVSQQLQVISERSTRIEENIQYSNNNMEKALAIQARMLEKLGIHDVAIAVLQQSIK